LLSCKKKLAKTTSEEDKKRIMRKIAKVEKARRAIERHSVKLVLKEKKKADKAVARANRKVKKADKRLHKLAKLLKLAKTADEKKRLESRIQKAKTSLIKAKASQEKAKKKAFSCKQTVHQPVQPQK
jgi:hypothetical protein